jgi:hypothetical protein
MGLQIMAISTAGFGALVYTALKIYLFSILLRILGVLFEPWFLPYRVP